MIDHHYMIGWLLFLRHPITQLWFMETDRMVNWTWSRMIVMTECEWRL